MIDHQHHEIHDRGLGPLTPLNWLPLAGVFGFIIGATLLWGCSVEHFMAVFFVVFALFKLTNLKGFVAGYAEYDLLAMRWRDYGYVYPFLELAFGVAMTAGVVAQWFYGIEFGVMVFSGLGVVRKMLLREEVPCVCLGTWLKLPLTSVTLVEDFGMATLAAYLFFR